MTTPELECAICLDPIDIESQKTTECNHTFHRGCLAQIRNNKCPLCRHMLQESTEVGPEDSESDEEELSTMEELRLMRLVRRDLNRAQTAARRQLTRDQNQAMDRLIQAQAQTRVFRELTQLITREELAHEQSLERERLADTQRLARHQLAHTLFLEREQFVQRRQALQEQWLWEQSVREEVFRMDQEELAAQGRGWQPPIEILQQARQIIAQMTESS